jgi:hypothetical protein
VAARESDRVRAKHAQVNLHIFGPQVIVASNTFCGEPTSKIAKETFENLCDMWRYLVNDVIQVAKEILESFKGLTASHSPMLGSLIKSTANNSTSHLFPLSNNSGQQQQLMPGYRDPLTMEEEQQQQQLIGYNNSISGLGQARLVASNNNNGIGSLGRGGGHQSIPRQHYQPPYSHSRYPADRGHPDGMSHRSGDGTWGGGSGYGGGGDFPPYMSRGTAGLSGGGYIPGSGSRSGMAAALDILDMYKEVGGEENAILKHARAMLCMAQVMHKFTLGSSPAGTGDPGGGGGPIAGTGPAPQRKIIKTTQDFFTQAEFFAEESNRLYKLIRMFSYLVPTGEDKRMLMQIADHIPRHCGQMQLLIQLPGVGKESTFRKVDAIIKENNQIVYLVAKVVQICFANAKKYELDFRGVTLAGPAGGSGDDAAATFGSSGGAGGGGSSSLDTGIGFGSSRRGGPPAAAAGNKRTRVSFLLY